MTDDAPERDGAPPSSQQAERADEASPTPTVSLLRQWFSRDVIRIPLALLAFGSITAVNVVLILNAGPPGDARATTSLEAPLLSDRPAPSQAMPGPLPPLEKVEDATVPSEPDEVGADDEPTEPKPEEPKRFKTVQQAAARSCSTSSVDGLSRQIIAQARCIDADAFAPVPSRPNLVAGSHVFLHLQASARDRLLRVLDAHPGQTMTINSALRTVAQQYLLSRWGASKRCGVQLATLPGESNHETGLALDIAEASKWRAALEAQGFRWLGAIDKVHFDYQGSGAAPRGNLDVIAFQQLWNRNHPDDPIAESGHYSSATEQRLKKSPPGGFASAPRCDRARGSAAAAHRDRGPSDRAP
jgi:hypothetical protein